MTSGTRRHAAIAAVITLTFAVALTGCGSRLALSKVLAENASLGAAANNSGGRGTAGSNTNGNLSNNAPTGGASTNGSATGQNGASGAAGSGSQQSGSGTQTGSGTQSGSGTQTGSGNDGPATLSTVNIGQIGTDSGVVGSILGQARTGAEIWASYINQHGGLNGHKVKLITADDGGDPSTGLSEAKTMVEQDHVLALIASDSILSTPTIAPYLQQVKVPDIGGADAETDWYTNPDFFPEGASPRISADGDLKSVISQGHTKIGSIYCVEFALICSNYDTIMKADAASLGGQVVYSASVSIAQPDYTAQCIAAKNAGVNAMGLWLDGASQDRLTADCATQGYHPLYFTQSLTFVASMLTPSNFGNIAAGGVFPYPFVGPATAAFDAAVNAATGGPPTAQLWAGAWVAGLILQAAAKDLPASNPTSADVLSGLYQIKNDNFGGLTPPLTYVPGQPTPSTTCYFLLQINQGGFGAPDGIQPQCLPASSAPPTP